MKTEQALVAISEQLAVAIVAVDHVTLAHATGAPLNRTQVSTLLGALRSANCAAQELDRRAAGMPEPQRGDAP